MDKLLSAPAHSNIISHFGVTIHGSDIHSLKPDALVLDNVSFYSFCTFLDLVSDSLL